MGKFKRKTLKGKGLTATEKILESVDPSACLFCESTESSDDGGHTGMLINTEHNFSVHYFCMLFASGLYQRGDVEDEKDVLKGFLRDDIFREKRRASKLRCSFCKEPGAPTGCIERKCHMKYHFGCGRRNGVLFQFYGSFCSFCAEHRPHQDLNKRSRRLSFKGTAKTQCPICIRPVSTRTSNNTLGTPCCKKFFHRECMQQMGTSSGYVHFKCPTCNNVEEFRQEMLKFGIYLPDQDAAWELEPNAFTDLHRQYSHCDARECLNPQGRDHFIDIDNNDWEIVRCRLCGSQASHWKCNGHRNTFLCRICRGLARKNKGRKKKRKRLSNQESVVEVPTKSGDGQSKFKGPNAHLFKKRRRSECADSPNKRQRCDDDDDDRDNVTTSGDETDSMDLSGDGDSDFDTGLDTPTDSRDDINASSESDDTFNTASEMSSESESRKDTTMPTESQEESNSTVESQDASLVTESKDIYTDHSTWDRDNTFVESSVSDQIEQMDLTANDNMDNAVSRVQKSSKKKAAIKFWGFGKTLSKSQKKSNFVDFSKGSPEEQVSPSRYIRELPNRKYMCTICLKKFPDYKCRATHHIRTKHLKCKGRNISVASASKNRKETRFSTRKDIEAETSSLKPKEPKKRCTKRSLAAMDAALELKKLDKSSVPQWSRALLEEDFLTGKNLGSAFAEISPAITVEVQKKETTVSNDQCLDAVPSEASVANVDNSSSGNDETVVAMETPTTDDTDTAKETTPETKAKKKHNKKTEKHKKGTGRLSESDNSQSDGGHRGMKQSLLTSFFIRKSSPSAAMGAPPPPAPEASSAEAKKRRPRLGPKMKRSRSGKNVRHSGDGVVDMDESGDVKNDTDGKSIECDGEAEKEIQSDTLSYADFLKSYSESASLYDSRDEINTSREVHFDSEASAIRLQLDLTLDESLSTTNSMLCDSSALSTTKACTPTRTLRPREVSARAMSESPDKPLKALLDSCPMSLRSREGSLSPSGSYTPLGKKRSRVETTPSKSTLRVDDSSGEVPQPRTPSGRSVNSPVLRSTPKSQASTPLGRSRNTRSNSRTPSGSPERSITPQGTPLSRTNVLDLANSEHSPLNAERLFSRKSLSLKLERSPLRSRPLTPLGTIIFNTSGCSPKMRNSEISYTTNDRKENRHERGEKVLSSTSEPLAINADDCSKPRNGDFPLHTYCSEPRIGDFPLNTGDYSGPNVSEKAIQEVYVIDSSSSDSDGSDIEIISSEIVAPKNPLSQFLLPNC